MGYLVIEGACGANGVGAGGVGAGGVGAGGGGPVGGSGEYAASVALVCLIIAAQFCKFAT